MKNEKKTIQRSSHKTSERKFNYRFFSFFFRWRFSKQKTLSSGEKRSLADWATWKLIVSERCNSVRESEMKDNEKLRYCSKIEENDDGEGEEMMETLFTN